MMATMKRRWCNLMHGVPFGLGSAHRTDKIGMSCSAFRCGRALMMTALLQRDFPEFRTAFAMET